MPCLGAVLYDPATVQLKGSGFRQVMTIFDLSQATITFTVPSNGRVRVRIQVAQQGGSAPAHVLLGVIDQATDLVKGRVTPKGHIRRGVGDENVVATLEADFVVSGLTPAASLTWRAAYGFETSVTGSQLKYGGPDDTTVNNAFGGLAFEIWS